MPPILYGMRPADDSYAWVSLTRALCLTTECLAPALQRFGSAASILAASPGQRAAAGLPDALERFLAEPEARPTVTERHWLADPRHHLIPFTAPSFPPLLRRIEDCPIALYVDGRPDALLEPQLAIVGSRNPTRQGLEHAHDFARSLATHGLTITSGLAEGIDAASHRGALSVARPTVAVLGCGVDRMYPMMHCNLGRQIAGAGALVSEFPLAWPARRVHFPRRNRIIAALTLGTLVVEAAIQSGSLITARLAALQGRKVFALPGSIQNPLARGCHELIKLGAKLTESPYDILREFDFRAFPSAPGLGFSRVPGGSGGDAGMDNDHKILLDALGFDPADLDALVVRTGFKPEAVSSMMLILELEGYVQAAPGGRYSRVARSP
jgi:DNA processing protein